MTSSEQTKRATVDPKGDREIHIERIFDAPRDRVFAVFMDPELIPRWWGPHGTETIVEEMEPRTGGDWRFLSRGADGAEISAIPAQPHEMDGDVDRVAADRAAAERQIAVEPLPYSAFSIF